MLFDFGQRVRLNRDLQMVGFTVVKNTQGTVTNVHLQTSVLFDGMGEALVVADSDLSPAPGAPAPSTQKFSAATAQVFQAGDRVRLLVDKQMGGQTIRAGSLGTVTQDAPLMGASWVVFDGFSSDKLVPNFQLART